MRMLIEVELPTDDLDWGVVDVRVGNLRLSPFPHMAQVLSFAVVPSPDPVIIDILPGNRLESAL